jgi:hypothetical protein
MLMERVVSAMAAEGRPVGLQLGDEVFHLGEHRTYMSLSSSMLRRTGHRRYARADQPRGNEFRSFSVSTKRKKIKKKCRIKGSDTLGVHHRSFQDRISQ